MACKLPYLENKPFEEKAIEIHNEIHNFVSKQANVFPVNIKDNIYLKVNNDFDQTRVESRFGKVITLDRNFLAINALKSKQYLDFKINHEILNYDGFKSVDQLSTKELIEQDTKFSPTQLSDTLKLEYMSLLNQYNFDFDSTESRQKIYQ